MNFNQLKVALFTLVHKEIRRFMRIWPQTLLPPARFWTAVGPWLSVDLLGFL
jgi:hypothetical protein